MSSTEKQDNSINSTKLVVETQLVNVQIDGVWHQFPKKTRLIEVCQQTNKSIPHYCYHPSLSSPGNCRMCLVEVGSPKLNENRKVILGDDGFPIIAWNPRPAISCALEISDGMAVKTDSVLVEECRKGVMEFLLINHPLDCPICDKAGECRLQEFSFEHGHPTSRFLENKVKKPKQVDIGERIILDDERCILCSRCIRFMQEIPKDDVLGFVQRGSYTTLTVHPGKRLDSNYSLNTVDICPVGALTSKDFRFKMRVWFLKETKTIDTNCGTGCNILIGSRENQIYRITPRYNPEVNDHWMPDSHRLNYTYLQREDRLVKPIIKGQSTSWAEAMNYISKSIQLYPSIAIIASGKMTNEELFITQCLKKELSIELSDIKPRPQTGDNLLIATDGNPNTSGAILFGISSSEPGSNIDKIIDKIKMLEIQSLIVVGENPLSMGLSETDLINLKFILTIDILPNSATPFSTVVLPGVAPAEKRGSMINIKKRLQRLNQAIQAPGQAKTDWSIFNEILKVMNCSSFSNFEDMFQKMSQSHPALSGLNFGKIGDLGIDLTALL